MKWKIATGLVVILVILGIVASLYFVNRRNVTKIVEQGDRANLLFMGLDYVEGTSRSDTLMFVSVGSQTGDIKVISIPRDMYVKYPDEEFRRINVAYPIGGGELARQLVSNLLDAPIQFHAVLDYEGFQKLVDLIGGVEITVEERLQYVDTAAEPPLHIDLEPGKQVLTGEEALGYIRYRGVGGSDIARIERQQKFIEALMQQGIQFRGWSELKDLLTTARKYLKTNLSLVDMYDLGKMVQGVDLGNLTTATLPGTSSRIDGKAVLQPQVVGIKKIVAQNIYGYDLLEKSDVNVLVLNGEGSAWLAHNTSLRLKDMGYSVVGADNADRFDYQQSFVVNLNSDGNRKAQMIRNALDVNSSVVTEDQFSTNLERIKQSGVNIPSQTDVVLILGKGSGKLVS